MRLEDPALAAQSFSISCVTVMMIHQPDCAHCNLDEVCYIVCRCLFPTGRALVIVTIPDVFGTL